MSETTLATLPSDVLLLIIENIGNDTFDTDGCVVEYSTKHLLSKCFRRFNILITSPMLYQKFLQTGTTTVSAFLHRLISMPELGKLVKKAVLSSTRESYGWRDMKLSELDAQYLTRRREALRPSIGISEALYSEWLDDFEQEYWNPVAPLILSFLPNLKEIGIKFQTVPFQTSPETWINACLDMANISLREERLQTNGFLQKLEVISLSYRDVLPAPEYHHIDQFLSLPNIKKISMEGYVVDELEDADVIMCHAESLELSMVPYLHTICRSF